MYDVVLHLNERVRNIKLLVIEAILHKDDDGGPKNSETGFLIGMDVLGFGDFFTGLYRDEEGKPCTMFSFRIPSAFEPVDYYQEVEAFNRRHAEKQARIEFDRSRRTLSPKRKPKSKR